MVINKTQILTPLGNMIAYSTDKGICLLDFENRKKIEQQIDLIQKYYSNIEIVEKSNSILEQLKMELDEYFNNRRRIFSIPLDMIGTEFQKQVWSELLKIPYGNTISYQQEANKINNPKGVRAVANANASNKIAIIIPCHRVIGSNGSLTGYAGGIERKQWLLNLENPQNKLF